MAMGSWASLRWPGECRLCVICMLGTFLKLFFKDTVHMSVFHHRLLPVQENFLLKFQVRLCL